MRYIFVDEAGTSALEPVTVVVGLIANADVHVMAAERLAKEALGAVPEIFRDDFVFHATQVFGDKKYQSDWSMTDRLRLLETMMSIPRAIGMAITLSAVWRNSGVEVEALPLSKAQVDHLMAFGYCLAVSDRNIRRYAGPSEVATVVAEDVPEMRRFLRRAIHFFRDQPFHMKPEHLRKTHSDVDAGYSTQSGELRVTRIRNAIHFVDKADDPLVQVADACAYGFRRYFAKEKFGGTFVKAILGDETLLRNFSAPTGAECWWQSP